MFFVTGEALEASKLLCLDANVTRTFFLNSKRQKQRIDNQVPARPSRYVKLFAQKNPGACLMIFFIVCPRNSKTDKHI